MALEVTVVDVNDKTVKLTGNDTVLIKYHSHVNVLAELTSEVMLGACLIINGNERVYGYSHTFYNVESNEFRFSCRDSDNITHEKVVVYDMIDYIPLTCTAYRPSIDGEGNASVACEGEFCDVFFGAKSNELTVQCKYIELDGTESEWFDMDVRIHGDNFYADALLTGLDYRKAYSFEFRAEDSLMEVTAKERRVTSKPTFHWGRDSFTFETEVRIGGNDVIPDGEKGNYLRFGDGDLCYIAESGWEENDDGEIMNDDYLTVCGTNGINLKTNGEVCINGTPLSYESGTSEHGYWQPNLFPLLNLSYTVQEGWYNKCGNTVTVGFYIEVDCPSGWEDSTFEIVGLPYAPSCPAAGGGMCSGAYVSGGYNFQCFVAETDGTITTRVQKCNNTSDSNLGTSARDCNYRNGGGEITLSGTIIYMTEE